MNPDFELVLEDCLALLRSGSTLENCLSTYPDQAEDLRPLLTAAEQVRAVPVPRARTQAVEANRQRMFAALEQQNWAKNTSQSPVSNSGISRYTGRIWNFLRNVLIGKENTGMKFALRLALDFVILLAVVGAYTLNASASTLPGDPLYGVKRTWEEVRLTLTTNDQTRQQMQAQLEAKRRAEIEQLVQLRRPVFVEFEGSLEQMGTDTWVVNGLQFKVLPETIVQGTPAVGQRVWLRASIQADGQMIVHEVHVQNTPYPGYGPQGTYVPQVQSTYAPLPTNGTTSIPGQVPWGSQSPVRTPVPGQWMNTMPHNYNDYHYYYGPSSTSAPNAVPSQPAAPTSQYHNQPAPTQRPNNNHHQGPNQCWDCSHNNNWNNHDGGSGGGWSGGWGGGNHR